MPLRDHLLTPFPGANPSGVDLEDLTLLEEIRAERRLDADAIKMAVSGQLEEGSATNHSKIIDQTQSGLLTQSKDLWLAAYLTESLLLTEHLPGMTAGLTLIQDLLNTFWDTVYPALEGTSTQMRAVPLSWLGNNLDPSRDSSPTLALMKVPLTASKGRNYNLLQFKESRKVSSEEEVKGNESNKKARELAIKEGKITPEQFDLALRETPKAYVKELTKELQAAALALEALIKNCNERFGKDPPRFQALTTTMRDLKVAVAGLLAEKEKQEPDKPEEIAAAQVEAGAEGATADGETAGPVLAAAIALPKFADVVFDAEQLDAVIAAELHSLDNAVLKLAAVARYMRRNKPASPVPYLLLRAFRWGELRGADVLSQCLEAPPSAMRAALRQQFQAKNWAQVLEISEAAMGQAFGRGWLDLQRYTVLACQELGYKAAAQSVRSELKALLADLPDLPNQIMPDDTGVANPETIAWLKSEGFWTLPDVKPDAKAAAK